MTVMGIVPAGPTCRLQVGRCLVAGCTESYAGTAVRTSKWATVPYPRPA
jgi:hypothetical protein